MCQSRAFASREGKELRLKVSSSNCLKLLFHSKWRELGDPRKGRDDVHDVDCAGPQECKNLFMIFHDLFDAF